MVSSKSLLLTEIRELLEITVEAGSAILDIYRSNDFDVKTKSDNSPLTKADTAAHNLIKRRLQEFNSGIPVLSEEGKEIKYITRKDWKRFWLVDPLDGTKEFIKRNDEFTVNIALIENNEPVFGIIYAPAFETNKQDDESAFSGVRNIENNLNNAVNIDVKNGTLYYAQKDTGAFKISKNNKIEKLFTAKNKNDRIVAVRSRSHSSEEEIVVLNSLGVTNYIYVGSSLKFCMVAEGLAQIYYRGRPSNEWDVAAGYIIAKAAGAGISGLSFNKENLLNSAFLVNAL